VVVVVAVAVVVVKVAAAAAAAPAVAAPAVAAAFFKRLVSGAKCADDDKEVVLVLEFPVVLQVEVEGILAWLHGKTFWESVACPPVLIDSTFYSCTLVYSGCRNRIIITIIYHGTL
jgi:hypothetical protein